MDMVILSMMVAMKREAGWPSWLSSSVDWVTDHQPRRRESGKATAETALCFPFLTTRQSHCNSTWLDHIQAGQTSKQQHTVVSMIAIMDTRRQTMLTQVSALPPLDPPSPVASSSYQTYGRPSTWRSNDRDITDQGTQRLDDLIRIWKCPDCDKPVSAQYKDFHRRE